MGVESVKYNSYFQSVTKRGLILIQALLLTLSVNAGDLVTRPDKSAAWVRMPSRNATTGIDAVYYNPAGLIKSENGLYFSFSNQSVFQNIKIQNSYAGKGGNFPLNNSNYTGSASDIFSPSVYAVFKKDRFAVSAGYTSIGGNGNTIFRNGVPSLELYQADIVPFLPASSGATAYNSDIYLKSETSIQGLQVGFSYKINDIVSVAAGIRYVSSRTINRGHIIDVRVNVSPGVWSRADLVIDNIVARANNAFLGASGNRGTTDLVTAGLGALTLAQVPLLYISQTRREELEGALSAFGYPANTIIATADAVFRGVADKYNPAAGLLGDIFINDNFSGNGVTPLFSINISPSSKFNIAVKYEFATRMDMKSLTNGNVIRNDLPAMLSTGIEYMISQNLNLSAGSDYYFDKAADYGHFASGEIYSSTPTLPLSNSEIIDKNGISVHTGIEYLITEKLLLSCGYSWANKGVNNNYQSDLNFALASHNFGFGGEYSLNKKTRINLGAAYTFYIDDSKTINHPVFGSSEIINATEAYSKNRLILAAGIDLSF